MKRHWLVWLPAVVIAAGLVGTFARSEERLSQQERRILEVEKTQRAVQELKADQRTLKVTIDERTEAINMQIDRQGVAIQRQLDRILDQLERQ